MKQGSIVNNNSLKPLVSVVLCTYNTEKYIAEAIESILAQTYTNFEFIVWDDGSTDNTRRVVESFNDNLIHYYYHENTGLGMALKLACEKAHGKYIARMDSDDISLPARLEKEVNYMERDAFVFYRSFYDVVKMFPKREQKTSPREMTSLQVLPDQRTSR